MVELVEEEVLLMTASMVSVDRRLLMAATKTAASSSPLLFVALNPLPFINSAAYYMALGSFKTCSCSPPLFMREVPPLKLAAALIL